MNKSRSSGVFEVQGRCSLQVMTPLKLFWGGGGGGCEIILNVHDSTASHDANKERETFEVLQRATPVLELSTFP